MEISFGVDIGGTKISAAYILGDEVVATSRSPYKKETLIEDIEVLFRELCQNRDDVSTIGVSCAGLVDPESGVVRFAGNLGLENYQLAQKLQDKINRKVLVDNDARCAVWGEFSQAKGSLGANVAGIVLGTGVGGGLIVDSRLIRGKNGFAGELGHLPVSNAEIQCACGMNGCLESVAGGKAFESVFEKHSNFRASAEEIAGLAKNGDSIAIAAFAKVGQAVGEVIGQLDTALDLETVVIGGGFGSTLELWGEQAQNAYLTSVVGAKNRAPIAIVPSKLGDLAQLFGAAALR
jgi:glucokinase